MGLRVQLLHVSLSRPELSYWPFFWVVPRVRFYIFACLVSFGDSQKLTKMSLLPLNSCYHSPQYDHPQLPVTLYSFNMDINCILWHLPVALLPASSILFPISSWAATEMSSPLMPLMFFGSLHQAMRLISSMGSTCLSWQNGHVFSSISTPSSSGSLRWFWMARRILTRHQKMGITE